MKRRNALVVDGWQQIREELRVAREHLSDVTAELRQNLCTVERIRTLRLQRKIEKRQPERGLSDLTKKKHAASFSFPCGVPGRRGS